LWPQPVEAGVPLGVPLGVEVEVAGVDVATGSTFTADAGLGTFGDGVDIDGVLVAVSPAAFFGVGFGCWSMVKQRTAAAPLTTEHGAANESARFALVALGCDGSQSYSHCGYNRSRDEYCN
jgi:hypothetical protein